MAEIFLLTRGHKTHVEEWERSMRAQFFPLKIKKKLKDDSGREYEIEESQMTQSQLRPYQLWGYVLPEEFVEPVCKNLGIPTEEKYLDQKPNSPGTSFISGKGVKFHLEALRRLLGAEKLPPLNSEVAPWPVPIYRQFVNILGIGMRKDNQINTKLGEHEAL